MCVDTSIIRRDKGIMTRSSLSQIYMISNGLDFLVIDGDTDQLGGTVWE